MQLQHFFELLLGEQATASLVSFYNIVRQFSLSYFEIFFLKKKAQLQRGNIIFVLSEVGVSFKVI